MTRITPQVAYVRMRTSIVAKGTRLVGYLDVKAVRDGHRARTIATESSHSCPRSIMYRVSREHVKGLVRKGGSTAVDKHQRL